jgi:hypothetical protein
MAAAIRHCRAEGAISEAEYTSAENTLNELNQEAQSPGTLPRP